MPYLSTADNMIVPLGSGGVITVDVGSAATFRLSVDLSSAAVNTAIPSPTLDPARAPAPSHACGWSGLQGVCTSFGALLASPSGAWALYDANNESVLSSTAAPRLAHDGVVLSVASPGAPLATTMPEQPCLSNGMFGPPFGYAPGHFFAFAVSEHLFDPSDPLPKHVRAWTPRTVARCRRCDALRHGGAATQCGTPRATRSQVHCSPNDFSGLRADPPPPPPPKGDMCAAGIRQADHDADGFVRTKEHSIA